MITEDDIPENWNMKQIGEISEIINGDRSSEYPSKSEVVDTGIPFVKISNVNDKEMQYDEMDYITEEKYNKLSRGKLQGGDFVLCIRGSVGRFGVFRSGGPYDTGFINASATIIRLSDDCVNHRYFEFFLESLVFQNQLDSITTGAVRGQVPTSKLDGLYVPLPPLEEQERIVSVLDDAFESLDRVDDLSTDVSDYADEFTHAVSNLHYNGNPVSDEWGTCKLSEAVEYKSNLTTPKETPNQEFTLLHLEDVEPHTGRILGTKQMPGSEVGSSKREFGTGDILYCKLRPYLNKVVCPDFEGVASSELLVLEPNDEFLKEYIAYFLRSPTVWRRAKSLMKGSNHPRINKNDLLSFTIPKPSVEEQKEIVTLLNKVNERVRLSVTGATQIEGYSTEIRDSFLQQAFTGQLLRD